MRQVFRKEDDGKTYYENGSFIGEVLIGEDGYYAWWPNQKAGYLDEGFLYALYLFLRELNADWDKVVNESLA